VGGAVRDLGKTARERVDGTDVPDRIEWMKRLLVPVALGVSAARHLAWYVSYQVTGEPRSRG
jgi:hypothetical protein